MNCKMCDRPIPPNEVQSYGGRCEDCWCCPPDSWPSSGGDSTYSSVPVGNIGEVTSGGNFHLGNL